MTRREEGLTYTMAIGKSGPRPSTKVGTVLQVEAPPAPRSSNVLKRPHIHHSVRPVSSLEAKQLLLPSLSNTSSLQTRNQNKVRTANTGPTRVLIGTNMPNKSLLAGITIWQMGKDRVRVEPKGQSSSHQYVLHLERYIRAT